jgi:hypothetical protein
VSSINIVTKTTILSIGSCYHPWMEQENIQQLIDRAIRAHEIRVALWSGLLGLIFTAGTWHAIWMCR